MTPCRVEIWNTDAGQFGGSGVSFGGTTAAAPPWNDLSYSINGTVPPLSRLWLGHDPLPTAT